MQDFGLYDKLLVGYNIDGQDYTQIVNYGDTINLDEINSHAPAGKIADAIKTSDNEDFDPETPITEDTQIIITSLKNIPIVFNDQTIEHEYVAYSEEQLTSEELGFIRATGGSGNFRYFCSDAGPIDISDPNWIDDNCYYNDIFYSETYEPSGRFYFNPISESGITKSTKITAYDTITGETKEITVTFNLVKPKIYPASNLELSSDFKLSWTNSPNEEVTSYILCTEVYVSSCISEYYPSINNIEQGTDISDLLTNKPNKLYLIALHDGRGLSGSYYDSEYKIIDDGIAVLDISLDSITANAANYGSVALTGRNFVVAGSEIRFTTDNNILTIYDSNNVEIGHYIATPSSASYVFDKWTVDDTAVTEGSGNSVVVAKFRDLQYTLRFHANDGEGEVFEKTVKYSSVEKFPASPFVAPIKQFEDGTYQQSVFLAWATTPNYDSSDNTYYTQNDIMGKLSETDGAIIDLYAHYVEP